MLTATMRPYLLLLSITGCLLSSIRTADAQIGVSLCACQPASYQFTLNFDLTCNDQNVAGKGIVDTACVLNTQDSQNVTDFVPVSISQIQVLELDQNLQVVFQTTYDQTFVNGDVFNYTSITQTQTASLNETSLPRGFQMFLTGRNAEEQDLVNFYAIVYDNACGLFPLLQVGMNAGWTVFSDLGPPPRSLCPAVPVTPTVTPGISVVTSVPTLTPNVATSVPSLPLVAPVSGPSSAPVAGPSSAPVAGPSGAPVRAPSHTPTIAPTKEKASTAPVIVSKAPTTSTPITPRTSTPTECLKVVPVGGKRRNLMVGQQTSYPTVLCPEPLTKSLTIAPTVCLKIIADGGKRRHLMVGEHTPMPSECLPYLPSVSPSVKKLEGASISSKYPTVPKSEYKKQPVSKEVMSKLAKSKKSKGSKAVKSAKASPHAQRKKRVSKDGLPQRAQDLQAPTVKSVKRLL